MQRTYRKSQRLIAHILLLSSFLQSCLNPPLMPIASKEETISTSGNTKASQKTNINKKGSSNVNQVVARPLLPKQPIIATELPPVDIDSKDKLKSVSNELLTIRLSTQLTPVTSSSTPTYPSRT
ncbi:hypothetical protein [Candidatus Amoebophilus asiaticus]|uniref:hypothetical protein n=1 Tax=Candidatus Amoebophilus asiaticus TaxID=281120 RepID=UPI0011D04473|nr:hypothetical protein [Candidatus Amoebophilus asiaticus]